jgi:hypothetical protein
MIGDPLLTTEPRRRRRPMFPITVWIPAAVAVILAWAAGTMP